MEQLACEFVMIVETILRYPSSSASSCAVKGPCTFLVDGLQDADDDDDDDERRSLRVPDAEAEDRLGAW